MEVKEPLTCANPDLHGGYKVSPTELRAGNKDIKSPDPYQFRKSRLS